jgi:AbrB family looped-hinge helix DNA binding protein
MNDKKNHIGENLQSLRKRNRLTQETVASKLNISRQAVAKWENGESLPDIENCRALAELYDVTLDDLISYSEQEQQIPIPPKGKYLFGSVTVGDRGQIVIPKKAREIFNIMPGDALVVLGDEQSGLALIKSDNMLAAIETIRSKIQEGKQCR